MTLSASARWWLKAVALAALAASVLALVALYVPVKAYSLAAMGWIQDNPAYGALVLPLVLTVGIPLWVPSPLFEMLAGCVFGVCGGAALSVAGKTGGSLLAFALGKKFGGAGLHGYMQTRFPTFAVLVSILQNASWKLLVLLQLANVPHSAKCYGLAIADVSTFRFTVSTIVGAAPYAVLWAYLGHQSKSLMMDGDAVVAISAASGQHQKLIGVSGAVFTVVSMAWMVVYTRKQFKEELLKHQQRTKSEKKASEADDIWIDIFEEEDEEKPNSETDQDDVPLVVRAKHRSCSCASIKHRGVIVV